MARQVSVTEAADLMKQGWKYLDVRSIPEFEQGHPEGAANIPLLHSQAGRMVPNPEFQQVVQSHYGKDDKVLVGCKTGGRSSQAIALLEAAGYTELANVRGGFVGERDMYGRVAAPGWSTENLPTSKTAEPGKSYAELAAPKG